MWSNPPENLILKEDEAHIWHADLDVDESFQNSFRKILSSDEKKEQRGFVLTRIDYVLLLHVGFCEH